jgi:alpha-tubulin suppressor-like RCC1 family protein
MRNSCGRAPIVAVCAVLATGGCDGSSVGPVEEQGGFVAVTAGLYHSCGLTEEATAYCWGGGVWGQTGTGRSVAEAVPAAVAGNLSFTELSAGALHTCGIEVGGRVVCWGVNTRGQLGLNSTVSTAQPVGVVTEARFTGLSAGWLHTCAVTESGETYCWGHNGQNQVGAADRADQLRPARLETGLRFSAITAGGSHSCALTAEGQAFCWGANAAGQLGDGSTSDAAIPQAVAGGHSFRMISAGYSHTCGVTTAGVGMCWGSSNHGELGTAGFALPGMAGAVVPQPVAQGHPYRLVSAGWFATCAVAATNRAWCWGLGSDGQLGIGSTVDHTVPQPLSYPDHVPLLVRNVSVGVTHACAVAGSGVALCWGRGEHGQLGSRTTGYSPLPLRVSGK